MERWAAVRLGFRGTGQDTRKPPLGGMFVKLWSAVTVSGIGDGVRTGALPLLAAFLTRSPAQIAGVSFAQALPWLLFGLPSGVLADRLDRRQVLVVASVVRAAIMAAVTVTVALGHTPLALLYGAGFVLTTVTVFADSASQALLPDIVSTNQLERANGLLYISETTVSQFAGPPLGSLLFAINRTVPFAVDSMSFASCAALLKDTPAAKTNAGQRGKGQAGAREGLIHSIGTGLSWLRHQRILWYTIVASAVNNAGSEMLFGIFPLFALELLHIHPSQYGLLFLGYAAGAVVGGLTAGRVKRLVSDGPAITISVLVFGLPLLLMAIWPHALFAAAMMVVSGVGEGVWNAVITSLRQAVIPRDIMGRVLATMRLFSWGSMSIGAALAGIVGEAIGIDWSAIIGCTAIVATGLALAPFLRTATITKLRETNTRAG